LLNDYQADAFIKEPLSQHKEGLPLSAAGSSLRPL